MGIIAAIGFVGVGIIAVIKGQSRDPHFEESCVTAVRMGLGGSMRGAGEGEQTIEDLVVNREKRLPFLSHNHNGICTSRSRGASLRSSSNHHIEC